MPAGTSTDVQTTVSVEAFDAIPVVDAPNASPAYTIWRAEVPLSALSPSLGTGHVNIAAEVNGERLSTEKFLVFSMPLCSS